jgi:hypothetical protein
MEADVTHIFITIQQLKALYGKFPPYKVNLFWKFLCKLHTM